MKKQLLFLFFLISSTCFSQRWFAINDSTSYSYQGIDITVGRNKVYRNLNNSLTLIRDFSTSNPNPSEDYIRDFDFIDEDSWFVLVGSRYIGGTTELYKTNDAGVTWQLIIPQAQIFGPWVGSDGIADSINQIQVINNRIYLFDAYYISRVFYSDDFGLTWNHWFQGFWSHYYQIYACGNDLYLQGIKGDGFANYMIKIPDSFNGQVNLFPWPNLGSCHNGGSGCYYASSSLTVPEVYNYFKNLVENTICALNTEDNVLMNVVVSPNPTSNLITIDGITDLATFKIEVYDVLGQIKFQKSNVKEIDFSTLSSGIYFLKIIKDKEYKTFKIIRN
jgi:hypothetical protein